MDDLVLAAMAKWPRVPACHGWLGLSARGQWFMRDDAAQAAGSFEQGFDSKALGGRQVGRAAARGSELQHEALIAFIGRNYQPDELGRWFFQNGPQRVYVELQATPLVWRISSEGSVADHTGQPARVEQAVVDERGWLYFQCERGLGLVHTLDTAIAAEWLDRTGWPLQKHQAADLPARFGYVMSPQRLFT